MTLELKRALTQHRPVVGCWHAIQDPAVTETLRDIDLDFLTFDQQHVATNIQTLQLALIALRPTKLATLVRMLRNDTADIGQVLDAGADGVIVPMVNTEDDARRAVAAAKYPPHGVRSWGPRRAALKYTDADAYTRNANASLVFAQIETAEAVSNLDAILAVPGLDGVMIGPGDLAISLGYLHDLNHAEVRRVFQGVLDRCRERGVPFGIFTASVSDALDWIERGALIVNCYADAVFVTDGMSAMASQFSKVRSEGR